MQRSKLLDAVSLVPSFEPVVGLSCVVENSSLQASDFRCLICRIQCDMTSIVNHLVSFQHRMDFLKQCKPVIYNDVVKLASRNQQFELVKRKCLEIQAQEGRGRPQQSHQQNVTKSKTVGNDDKQAPFAASSVECPLFDSVQRGFVSTQRTQAILSLRLLLVDELNKRGIPPQLTKEIVEARLQLLEQYEKQGVPFHIAKERVIHEEERWNLLVEFERQSLSFEEAEQRIDRRFYLLNLYESQGMRRADAARKIIQEEVVRDFKAEFVKLGFMHTEAQELAEKRLLLLDSYRKQGFSSEEASRKVIAEELPWRDSTNSLSRKRQSSVDFNHLTGDLKDRPSFWQEHGSLPPAVASRRDPAAATSAQQVDVKKKGTEAETCFSQNFFPNVAGHSAHSPNSENEPGVATAMQLLEGDHSEEDAFKSRISKLLQKLVSCGVRSTQASEGENQECGEAAEKTLEKLQASDSRNLSEADKEFLLKEFEKKCREEIQKLLTQLLEHEVPPEEAGARLQTLKAEHENRRHALFLSSWNSRSVEKDGQHRYQSLLTEKIGRRKEFKKDPWTEGKGTLSPERRPTTQKERDQSVSGMNLSSDRHSSFQKQRKRQRSEEDREFLRSSGSGSPSSKHQRPQSSSSRSTSGSPKRRMRKRMQRDNQCQSSDSEESRKSFRKLYNKTKPLGALDFFEQVLKGTSTSDNKTPLPSAGPSFERRPDRQSPSHLKSFSPCSHGTASSYSRNRSRSPWSRTRSASVKSEFSRRRSRHRSRSLLQSSNYMHQSGTRSPAFRLQHSGKGHVPSSSWHSRFSDISSHGSRSRSTSSRSRQTKNREDTSKERAGYFFRKSSNVPCSPERQRLRYCSRSRSQSPDSGQSFIKRYRERSYSRKRMPLAKLHAVSPPSLADYSPRRTDDESPSRRWSSSMRDQSSSTSRQFRDCSRETSKWRQHSARYDHHGARPFIERHRGEGRRSWHSERPGHNNERHEPLDNATKFHFQSGVWYDSDVDDHSLSSLNSSSEKVLISPEQQVSEVGRPPHSTNHAAKLDKPWRKRKRLPSMESISSCDNDEVYGVQDCGSVKDSVEPSGAVLGGIKPSGTVKDSVERSRAVQGGIKLSGLAKDSSEPSGSVQSGVKPSGSAKDGVCSAKLMSRSKNTGESGEGSILQINIANKSRKDSVSPTSDAYNYKDLT